MSHHKAPPHESGKVDHGTRDLKLFSRRLSRDLWAAALGRSPHESKRRPDYDACAGEEPSLVMVQL